MFPTPPRLALLLAAIALTVGASDANAASSLPVSYSSASAIAAAVKHPGDAPPGANDWACRPSAAHPRPVVLVHGLFANMTDNWQTMSPLLPHKGYCVFPLAYGVDPKATPPGDEFGGQNTMEQSAAELAAFVKRVL